MRIATTGLIPSRWFLKPPDPSTVTARSGILNIEIVSHCWQYAHLLAYQLSSLVNFPPVKARVRMTVFHAPEDTRTRAMLDYFGGLAVPGVSWNWQALSPPELFRRAIGRNRIARSTKADWVWFTDCDIVFHRDCIDSLATELQARQDLLTYPKFERITPMLAETDPVLAAERDRPRVVDIDTSQFTLAANPPKAKGAYHIVHGDAARQCGYCEQIPVYQRPAAALGQDVRGQRLPLAARHRRRRARRAGRSPDPARPQGPLRRKQDGRTRAWQHPAGKRRDATVMTKVDSKTWTIAEAGAALAKSGATFVNLFARARSRSRSIAL